MNTSDVNAWKELLQNLMETSQQNQVIITEIKEEVERQKQRNKKQVQELKESLEKQARDLEELITSLQQDNLFSLPSEKGTLDSFLTSLHAQLDKTRNIIGYTDSMLESAPTEAAVMEKIKVGSRASREKTRSYLPKLFRKEHILGNWVHYFNDATFTCQSFWEDGSFKEYDFDNGQVVGEREGLFSIDNGKIDLLYGSGKKDEYYVTGFSDERIDYLIHGQSVQFSYMPETLLNNFLEADSQ